MNRVGALVVLFCFVAVQAADLLVPALESDGRGAMTRIEAQALPGDGDVFVSVTPLTGVDTQESEKIAVRIAALKAGVNRSKYDVLFKIVSSAEVVDGPSAGAALTVLSYAEFTKKAFRKDVSVSGTIQRDGRIGPVGGIFEKTVAVGESGTFSVFLVPKGQSVQNGVDLNTYAQEKWGLQVVEVETADELLYYAFNTSSGEKLVVPEKKVPPLSLVSLKPTASMLPLKSLTENMLEKSEEGVQALSGESNSLVRARLRESLNLSRTLLEKGYLYSSANTAFLVQITLDELKHVNQSRKEVRDQLAELKQSADGLDFATPKKESWEWYAASKIRFYWAKERLQAVQERAPVAPPDFLLEDLSLARSWLDASRQLNAIANASMGTPFNELSVRRLAEAYLDEAEQLRIEGSLDDEGLEHLQSSRQAFQNADYLAAAFNAQFVTKYAQANALAYDKTYAELFAELCEGNLSSCLAPQNFSSPWASLYFDHGRYYVQEANRTQDLSPLINAAKMFYLAEGLEELHREVQEAFSKPLPSPSASPSTAVPQRPLNVEVSSAPEPDEGRNIIVFSIIALVVLLAALVTYLQWRKPRMMRGKAGDYARRLERAEALLLEGKISEQTYRHLKEKYETLLQEEKNVKPVPYRSLAGFAREKKSSLLRKPGKRR